MRHKRLAALLMAGGTALSGCHTIDLDDPATARVVARDPRRPSAGDDEEFIATRQPRTRSAIRPARNPFQDPYEEPENQESVVRVSGDQEQNEAPPPPQGDDNPVGRPRGLRLRSREEAGEEAAPGSLSGFEALALRNNPSLGEAQARVDALRGKWVQVGLNPNPTAGYAASEVGNEGHAGQQGVYFGQEIVTGGKLRLNRDVTSLEIRRAARRVEVQRQRVLTDVRIGYYDVLIAQRRVELTRDLQQTTRRAVETADGLFKAKEGAKADVLQARVESESAAVLVQNAEAAHAAAWLQLAAVTGCPSMPKATLSGNVEEKPPEVDYEGARVRLLSASPELAVAHAEANRARCAIGQAQAQAIPNIDLQTTRQRDDSTGYMVTGIQGTIPVPVFNRNQGGIRQSRSELVAASRAVNRVELSLERRLASTYQRYLTARQQSERYSGKILPAIRETQELVSASYRAGELSFVQLLTAQRTYVQANLIHLDALREMWSAYFEMEGLLLKDSLDQTTSNE